MHAEYDCSGKLFESRIVAADLVISDTLRLLKSMTNHDALYSLLCKIVLFRDLPYMSKVSENKLMNTLTDFTHPGGPYFPTRPVRHLASHAMVLLFPQMKARRLRKLVHSFFRLLHPYYWSESVAFHTLKYAKEVARWIGRKVRGAMNKCIERVVGRLK